MGMMSKLPPGHPAESTEFRERFRQAAVLLSVYRVVGTAAALSQFVIVRGRIADDLMPIDLLLALYIAYTLAVLLWLLSFPPAWRIGFIGAGSRTYLDQRWMPFFDLALSATLNLAFVHLLRNGAAYEQGADLFAVAAITSATLWTGRYGRRFGACCLLFLGFVEVLKAPANGLALADVQWGTVVGRVAWAFCGTVIARGIVIMLSGWADALNSTTIGQSIVEKSVIVHDYFKWGLSRARDHLRSDGPADLRIDEALFEIDGALAAAELRHDGDDVAACVAKGVLDASSSNARGLKFSQVDAVGIPVWVIEPRSLTSIVRNLCRNAVAHSNGRTATVRWSFDEEWLTLTVRDDGMGVSGDMPVGTGIAQSREAAKLLGGELVLARPTHGLKWALHVPARTDRSEQVTGAEETA